MSHGSPRPYMLPPLANGTLTSSQLAGSTASSTPLQPLTNLGQERSGWEPFLMPTMDPLVRQQSLLFEHSELLREQFLKFGEGLQRLHGMLGRLHDDVNIESQQRLKGEEHGALTVTSLRSDVDVELKKHMSAVKQVDDRLLSLREEVVLRAKAHDTEMQRINSQSDALAADIQAQLAYLVESQQALGSNISVEIGNALHEERGCWQAACGACRDELLAAIATQVKAEAEQRGTAIQALETRLDAEAFHRQSTEAALREAVTQTTHAFSQALREESSSSAVARNALRDEILGAMAQTVDSEVQQRGVAVGGLEELIGMKHEECLRSLQAAELRQNSSEQFFSNHSAAIVEGLSEMSLSFAGSLLAAEAVAARESDSCKARLDDLAAASQVLGLDLDSERQHRGVTTVGVVTEVAALRACLASEEQSQQQTAALAARTAIEAFSLREAVAEREVAHVSLGEAIDKRTTELWGEANRLHTSLEGAVSVKCQRAMDDAKLGREELWHVLGSLQERARRTDGELQELDQCTRRIEVDRLGELAARLGAVSSSNGDVLSRVDTLEKYAVSREDQVRLTSRLDEYGRTLERTSSVVDGLVDNTASREFLESKNSLFRFCISEDGDIAVFQRSSAGKFGGSFEHVPRWHAGSGDRPLCSVNRDMQPHEKDRFCVMGNRAAAFLTQP